MSGSTSGIGADAPVNYGLSAVLIADNTIARNRETELMEQSSDGLVSDSFSGLGGAATQSALDLNAELSNETVWASNISAADTSIAISQSALTQVTSIATTLYSQVESLVSATAEPAGQVGIIATDAQQALQQVASLLDTTNGSTYVFAGQDSANPPVPDPNAILTSGFYTQINAAVSQLSANGATATAASTLAIASSNATGTSPFSAALSQPAATLVATRTTATVGDGQQVPIGLLASANAAVVSTGSSTTGSYMRDLMRALATVGSLTDAQANDPGFSGLLSDTLTSLNGAISAMGNEAGVLGEAQSAMDASGTLITDTQTSLTNQISNIQDVNLASTATQLTLAQTQLQASYQMISETTKLSLVEYI